MLGIVIRIAVTVLIVGESVAVAAAQPTQQAYEQALDDLGARVHQRTGTGAESCGNFFRIPGDSRLPTAARIAGALACGRRAASAGAPFWFAVGGHGLDSWVAEGLLASPNGPIERFSYDSDPGGGGGVSSRASFDSGRCIGARVHQYLSGGLAIECLNEPWKLVVHAVVLGLCLATAFLGGLLARSSWFKTSAAVLTLGAVMIAVVVGTLARLGGLRVDIALPAAAYLILIVGFLGRLLRRPTQLAATSACSRRRTGGSWVRRG